MVKIVIDEDTKAEVLEEDIKEIKSENNGDDDEILNDEVSEEVIEDLGDGVSEDDGEAFFPEFLLENNSSHPVNPQRFRLDNLKEDPPGIKKEANSQDNFYTAKSKSLYSPSNPEDFYNSKNEKTFDPEIYGHSSLSSFYEVGGQDSLYIAPMELNSQEGKKEIEIEGNLEKSFNKKEEKRDLMFRS